MVKMAADLLYKLKLQRESRKLPAHEENINVPRTGVPPPAVHEKPIKPKDQILQDCQKLVDYIVKQYPEGYHIRSFKNLFLERYGYSLDVNRLGYPNIGSLLQIMAGMKIDASHIKLENTLLDGSPAPRLKITLHHV